MVEPCPTVERLNVLLRGLQREDDDAVIMAHVADCPPCQARLETAAGGSGWLAAKAKTHTDSSGNLAKPLSDAMAALESWLGVSDHPAPPPKLDFLQPSDQPGGLGKFGSYEIIAHIASGGMGIVLKAQDPALKRIVALKILPPMLAANPLARARFVREARAAAAVVHEHVVAIHAVDESAGLPYIVMQFVQGRSLAERIRATGPLALEEILRIGAQTAAGLAAAHAQGLVHRDVKPGNILLENSVERVKLTDFGLARAVDDAGLTRTGELAGTPEFMSPEQASGESVDYRTDLFSLGSVMYAMATGGSPFRATSVIATVRKVCDEQPPPVHKVNPAIPHWLSEIVTQLMAKSPAQRFQSAREVGELLERYLVRVQQGEFREIPGTAKPRFSPRHHRQVAIGAALGLAIIGLLLFVLKFRRGDPAPSQARGAAAVDNSFRVHTAAGVRVGGFANIEAALAAVPPGGVIELCWNGPRDFNAITVPPKPLVLRAGQGFRPTWMSPAAGVSAISASSALTLEGIWFIMTRPRMKEAAGRGFGESSGFQPEIPRVPPSGLALLSITNGDLQITRCILNVAARGAPERAGIILENVGNCRIEDTQLFAANAKAIIWRQNPPGGDVAVAGETAQLTIINCIAVTGQVFWLDVHESSRARMEIARCTFRGRETFYFPPTYTKTHLEVNAHQNVFDTEFVMLDGRDPASPPLSQCLVWREQENLFSPDRQYVAGPAIENGLAKLDDWIRWWNQTAANSREVQVQYANGRGDRNRNPGPPSAELRSYELTDLLVTKGPPLAREEWSRFGADTAKVGPASQ